ncbi:hypothetical protein COV04_02420 [Candidatus Uhrbacteria bacterium CG10_big_fil_rev_8_21_14_0_10_48_11]|uniref:DUF192 domain-containing protein n=1 Tax=Candidatus Uhrbacteria bacterium CG10_big_fil_rev_8_21_14_0_10_48_11 TaxID=1975037 RepID=A0A2M8LE98_9BACT|nr:MAG: hypothetical protein COV04_02420 [Candidatus Uhrbacteria bacterium CG10_big_fil_rev_8_21_14_0_10_48_11]
MRRYVIAVSIAAFALLLTGSYFISRCSVPKLQTGTILLLGTEISVQVVSRNQELARGLSGRAELANNSGMFFIFSTDDRWGIWMKAMRFPIDIVWLSSDLKVVDIKTEVRPDTYPAVFKPATAARYVLELPSGWTSAHSVAIDNTATLSLSN